MNKLNISILLACMSVLPVSGSSTVITPQAIPGVPRSNNHAATGAYAPSNVQAQLKINVTDGTKEIKVIRDNSDPFVITKPYMLKNADPYAVRSYLEAAVGSKSVNDSPAQVTAVKFSDGAGAVLVSAEEYRFADSDNGKGIDGIVAALDRPGLTFLPDADAHIYFPRISRASNLRDMLMKVGSSELDPQFAVAPGTVTVDAELNALVIKANKWNWQDMLTMLKQYDRPIPEFKVTYRVIEIYAENDDRIGVDFQSWKNNEGVDLFSTGVIARRNWGTFFSSAIENNGSSRTSYWNFNPKWNTRYLDFMTSIGKAKCLAQGEIVVQNRKSSAIQVNSGFFYDRTYYTAGAKSIAEGCTEFTYTDINPDTIATVNGADDTKKSCILGSHWPNFLRYNSKDNFDYLPAWERFYTRQGNVFGSMNGDSLADAVNQTFYHQFASLTFKDKSIEVDLTKLEDVKLDCHKNEFYISVKHGIAPIKCDGGTVSLYDTHDGFDNYKICHTGTRVEIFFD